MGHPLLTTLATGIGMVMLAAAAAGGVQAFSEAPAGKGRPAAQTQPPRTSAPRAPLQDSAPKTQQKGPLLELRKPDSGTGLAIVSPGDANGGDEGTEVKIPGIGSIGVLPKLDFGLELLYGSNNDEQRIDREKETDDVRIRGTLKHRF